MVELYLPFLMFFAQTSSLWTGILIPFTGNVSLYYSTDKPLIQQIHFAGVPQSDTAQAVICGLEQHVYILNGRTVHRLSLADNRTLVVARMPLDRHLPSVVCLHRVQLYVCGGQALWTCDVMDTMSHSWTRLLTDMPRSMYLHLAVFAHTQLWLVGGYIHSEHAHKDQMAVESKQVYSYSPRLGIWTRRADLNEPRSNFAAVVLPDTENILVCGGGSESLSSCELYEHLTRRWLHMAPLQHGRFDHGMVLYGNEVYIMGGFCARCPLHTSRNHRLSSVEVYDYELNHSRLLNVTLPFASTAFGALALKHHELNTTNDVDHNVCSNVTKLYSGLLCNFAMFFLHVFHILVISS